MFDLNNTDIFNEHRQPRTPCVRRYGELRVLILGREKEEKKTRYCFGPYVLKCHLQICEAKLGHVSETSGSSS